MDHHAMSHGTLGGLMVGSLMDRAAGQSCRRLRWAASAAALPSLAIGVLLLGAQPVYARLDALPAPMTDASLGSLQAPNLARSPEKTTIVLAAKGGRLLNNGTRARSSGQEGGEETPDAAPDTASAEGGKAEPGGGKVAAPPAAASSPPAAAPAASRASTEQREQMTPIAGHGRNPSDIECVANCLRSTPTVRVGGPRGAPDPSLTEGGLECIAGCYGVNMTSTVVDGQKPPAAAPREEAQGSAPAGNRVTVLRGVTRTKSYTPAN